MKYTFETPHGKAFEIDCDPAERIQVIITRAALERGLDKHTAYIKFDGQTLDPTKSLADYGVDWKKDVLILFGSERREDTRDEDEVLAEAYHAREEGDHALFSLETLRDDINKSREKLDRPTFMSKAQREQLALKKREDAVRRQKEKLDELERNRQKMFEEARKAGKELNRRANMTPEERAKKTEALYARLNSQQEELKEAAVRRQEHEQIKLKYLGKRKEKKFIPKPSERFVKFTFDWNEGDDTSQDINPLYANPYEAQLLFGRGFKAGIDAREQSKTKVQYKEEVEKHETDRIVEELKKKQERKERRKQIKRMLEEEEQEEEDDRRD